MALIFEEVSQDAAYERAHWIQSSKLDASMNKMKAAQAAPRSVVNGSQALGGIARKVVRR